MAKKRRSVKKFSLPGALADQLREIVPASEQNKFLEHAIRRELKRYQLQKAISNAFGPYQPQETPSDRLAKIYNFFEETGLRIPFGRGSKKLSEKNRTRGKRQRKNRRKKTGRAQVRRPKN